MVCWTFPQSHVWLVGLNREKKRREKKRKEEKRKEKKRKGRTNSSQECGLGVTTHCLFLTVVPQ
jgi:hypothetical protein